jgi:orotate phosphoribosyltransferase
VSRAAASLRTDSVSTYLEVLDLAADAGLLDPTLHNLTVDAIVNRWTDDDPRWTLMPVTADGQLTLPLREACPFTGASARADNGNPNG